MEPGSGELAAGEVEAESRWQGADCMPLVHHIACVNFVYSDQIWS